MRTDPPHVGPTTTFLFQNSSKIVHFFQLSKKNIFLKFLSIPLTAQPYNFCSKAPRGLEFFMHSHPSWGAGHQNYKQKFDDFFSLISPTHYPAL